MKRKMTVLTVGMMLLLTVATLLTGQFKEEPFEIGDYSHVDLEEAKQTFETSQTNEDLVLLCKALSWQMEIGQNDSLREELRHYGQLLLDRAKAETVDLEKVDDPEIMLKVLKVIRSTGAK
jgi:hypothetical protein